MQRFVLCLKHVPRLQQLAISRNLCSMKTLELMGEEIRRGHALQELSSLDCNGSFGNAMAWFALLIACYFATVAITADANAMTMLMRAFQDTTLAQLRCVDIGGNPSGDPQACQLFTDMLTCMRWPQLQSFSLACTWTPRLPTVCIFSLFFRY